MMIHTHNMVQRKTSNVMEKLHSDPRAALTIYIGGHLVTLVLRLLPIIVTIAVKNTTVVTECDNALML